MYQSIFQLFVTQIVQLINRRSAQHFNENLLTRSRCECDVWMEVETHITRQYIANFSGLDFDMANRFYCVPVAYK